MLNTQRKLNTLACEKVCESGLRVTFALDDRLDKIHTIPVYSYFAVIPRPVFTLHHQYPWNGNRNIGGRNLKCVYQVYPEFELYLACRETSRESRGNGNNSGIVSNLLFFKKI